MSGVTGWAVKTPAGISVATVSPTRRAAIVNWLMAACNISVFQGHTDADIEHMWRRNAPPRQAAVIPVVVTEQLDA